MKRTHGLPASACTYGQSPLGGSVVSAPCVPLVHLAASALPSHRHGGAFIITDTCRFRLPITEDVDDSRCAREKKRESAKTDIQREGERNDLRLRAFKDQEHLSIPLITGSVGMTRTAPQQEGAGGGGGALRYLACFP